MKTAGAGEEPADEESVEEAQAKAGAAGFHGATAATKREAAARAAAKSRAVSGGQVNSAFRGGGLKTASLGGGGMSADGSFQALLHTAYSMGQTSAAA